MKLHFLCAAALACLPCSAIASEDFRPDGATQILWMQVFASPKDDWINHLLPLKDGNILATGFVGRDDNDKNGDWRALAVKLTRDGRILWRQEYGAGSGVDAFWAASEGRDGRIRAAGFTNRMGAGGLDAYLALLNADGALAREIAVGGPGYDRVTDIAPAQDGGFVAAGFASVDGKGRELLLVKVNAKGEEVWRRTYGGPGDQTALYIKPLDNGGFAIAGGTDESGDGDVLAMRVDAKGNEVWRTVIGERGTLDVPHSLSIHKDGRIQLVGYTENWGPRDHDLLAITLSADGAVLRHEVFGGPSDDRAMVANIDAEDRTWMTGYSKSAGAGGYDIFIASLDKDGGFENRFSTIGGLKDDNGTIILPLNDGTLLVGAYSANLGEGGTDAVVMRVRAPDWSAPPENFVLRKIR